VYSLDEHAADFLAKVSCEDITIVSSDVHRIESFLDGMIARGMQFVKSLTMAMETIDAFPMCHTLMHAVVEFGELENLTMFIGPTCQASACITFPSVMPKLRCLRILEDRNAPSRRLEVYFDDAKFPVLHTIELAVHTSDVLAHARTFHNLKRLLYRSDVEAFEDMCIDGMQLSELAVEAATERAGETLITALAKAHSIDKLVVTTWDDMCLDLRIPAKHMCIVCADSDIEIDIVFSVARAWTTLRIEAGETSDSWAVRFTGVGSWSQFWLQTHETDMHFSMEGTVSVEP
jgi:hypothetical protein